MEREGQQKSFIISFSFQNPCMKFLILHQYSYSVISLLSRKKEFSTHFRRSEYDILLNRTRTRNNGVRSLCKRMYVPIYLSYILLIQEIPCVGNMAVNQVPCIFNHVIEPESVCCVLSSESFLAQTAPVYPQFALKATVDYGFGPAHLY